VGWGIGEDELRVQSSRSVEALGIFLFGLRRIPYKSMGWILARRRRAVCDMVKDAARIAANQSAFERIYLLKALETELEVYEVFPVFAKCK
jgi:hypothetical protein